MEVSMRSRDKLYNTDRIVDPKRRELYEHLERERACQFCAEGIARGLVKKMHEGTHWYIVQNTVPYPGTRAHWMAVSKLHHLDLEHLDEGEGEELFAFFAMFMRECDARGAAMVMRYGDMSHTCSSIAHPHVHFIASYPGTLGEKTFQMDLGYWPQC